MPYAHKLSTYKDELYKTIVFCTVCGEDEDLAGQCPGLYVPTTEQQKVIDKQFREIFTK